jgi:septal ring factor EnvC (AmiA/AmiB activator)
MTIEQARAEIAEIQPRQDALWHELKAKEAQNKKIEDEWNRLYTRQSDLKAFIKVMGGETK